MRAGFRSPLRLLALVAPVQALRAGPLTAAQLARLRGWQAPPFRAVADETEDARAEAPAERDALDGEGARQSLPRTRSGGASPLALAPDLPTLATAHVADPGPDWASLLTLAVMDLHRRQALAQAAEDEAALLLMLVLLEELCCTTVGGVADALT
jgi:hypothetical protein